MRTDRNNAVKKHTAHCKRVRPTRAGGTGADYLYGGEGNDIYLGGHGRDIVLDSDGQGAIQYNQVTLTGGKGDGMLLWRSTDQHYSYTLIEGSLGEGPHLADHWVCAGVRLAYLQQTHQSGVHACI